jgi:hypothetical protein
VINSGGRTKPGTRWFFTTQPRLNLAQYEWRVQEIAATKNTRYNSLVFINHFST